MDEEGQTITDKETPIHLDDKDWQRVKGEATNQIKQALIMVAVNRTVLREANKHIQALKTTT